MANVTVQVQGGTPFTVGWTQGMTVQQAMEAVFNQTASTGLFTYALAYAGSAKGYVVTMINGTVDTPLLSYGPFFFWLFSVNGNPGNGNVSGTTLNAGGAVSFVFQQYKGSQASGQSALRAKYGIRAKKAAKKSKK